MIDVHLHTNKSDGSDTPLELLEKIESLGCQFFSITDHDDLRANAIILKAMAEKQYAAKFITGAEISSVFEDRNLHLLCYGFDPEMQSIKQIVTESSRLRRERIIAVFEHLKQKHNIVLPEKSKALVLSRAIPGKVHIVNEAIEKGITTVSRSDFFNNFLNDMETNQYKVPAEKVIVWVAEAGGIVSFAHPIEVQKEYDIDFTQIADMTKRLKNRGLAAIEVYHSLHGEQQINEYKKIADEFSMLISGGSDYHGKYKNVTIGQLSTYGYAPYNILSKICENINEKNIP